MPEAERGKALAHAAASMVGKPFRLHGRNPETGLDCVGLIAASLQQIGLSPVLPRGYTLRNSSIAQWETCFAQSGFEAARGSVAAGDLLVSCPGTFQHHLMIADDNGWVIHAHAGLRRVVRQPLPIDFAAAAQWRLQTPE